MAGAQRSLWARLRAAAHAGLDVLKEDHDSELVNYLLEETRTIYPLLPAFHVFASLILVMLCWPFVPALELGIWTAGSVLLFIGFVAGYQALGAAAGDSSKIKLVLRSGPFLGVGVNLLWGWAALDMTYDVGPQVGGMIDVLAVCENMLAILCCIRLPGIAMQFVFVPVLVVAARAVWHAGASLPLAVGLSLVPMFALSIAVLGLNVDFRRRGQLEKLRKRDNDVIKLLLNDLGSEMQDWLWETDQHGALTFTSAPLDVVLGGYGHGFEPSHFFESLFSPAAPELLAKVQERVLIREAVLTTTLAGAEKHWLVLAKPLLDGAGDFCGYRGVCRDVTVQRAQELQTAKARDEAQRANEAKSQFLGVISHELRTPINAIVGFSEVLSAGHGEHLPMAARREYLGTILESARHLQGLINDILEATRMEGGHLSLDEQPNDAAELIETAAKIVRDQAAQGRISIVARVIEDVVVTGDLTRLKQVVLNVLTNAIKFSPEGGIVQVDMVRGRGGQLMITVRDAGIGISAEDAERVFEPFVQVDAGSNRRFGGVGLGLAIARRIMRLHGGELTLTGEVGVGTEARVTLPAQRVRWPKATKRSADSIVAA